ncbi:hypothetical protein RclHR1_00280021 [Rhizophagus clarus]|uniref:Carbohydrate-binding module family 13 protein n=1 Tax=Rhizophagus clarus TaxID=94130 RepID=A0A2Z6RGV1_9GLOM|nr:hypothetical protein RclHR1_00280021 [Rhizophagus clarus]GES83742.1 carbohydrate-binding module family 13 protein [Rhizophagus clarus]
MVRNAYLQKLSQNLLEVLDDDDEYYDITIEVGNGPNARVFRAHMIILNYRSSYLKRILSTNKKKSDGTLIHIKLPNVIPEIFQIILRYIYGGKLFLEEYDTSDIVKILVAANELDLRELIPDIQSFLIENETEWIEQNFNMIYRTSFETDTFSELQNFCIELISKQPIKIFNSFDFTLISEKALISLIQHDKLQMSEIQVWEHALKWGIAQNPKLSLDRSNYSNDDYNILKNTLQQCIPLINFKNLTSKEFLDNIFPYQKILPEGLFIDLLKFFLDSDYKPSIRKTKEAKRTEEIKEKNEIKETSEAKENNSNKSIDSKIITHQHVELISKWIDKLEITDELKNLYEFKLILRGSRDGFTPERFHEICDNKPHTITIIKVEGSNEILGGYNPIIWESRNCADPGFDIEYSDTEDSFLFSFKNKVDIKNHILSRVLNKEHAIDNYYLCGPSFGHVDLKTYENKTGYCVKDSYDKGIRDVMGYFLMEEYEIFHINV